MTKNHWSKNRDAQMDKMQETQKIYWDLMILVEDDGFPRSPKVVGFPCAKWGVRAFGPQNQVKRTQNEVNTKKRYENTMEMNIPKCSK